MRKHFIILNIVLVLVALFIFSYKHFVLKFPLLKDATSKVWVVEAEIHYDFPEKTPLHKRKIRLNIPPKIQENFIIEKESFGTGGFSPYILPKRSGHRELVWSIRSREIDTALYNDSSLLIHEPILSAMNNVLYYRVYVRPRYDVISQIDESGQNPKVHMKKSALAPDLRVATSDIIGEIRSKSVDDESFVWSVIQRVNNPNTLDMDLQILYDRLGTDNDDAVIAYLLREANYPTRVAHGIRLEESTVKTNPLDFRKKYPIIVWYEIWFEDAWHTFYPLQDEFVADNTFVLWYDDDKMLNVPGHSDESVVLSIQCEDERTVMALHNQGVASSFKEVTDNMFYKFSMFSLPVRIQNLYITLLTIPIGAMLIIFFRNMVGIQTFGTFMPVLIAIAFRESSLLIGISLFVFLVGIGVLARSYLARFKLLLVPRLGAVLITVVLLMILSSMLIARIGFLGGLGVALFPLVILTMTIERMSVIWEERGPWDAFVQSIGSIAAATIVFLVITNAVLEHIIFVFPELLLICLSLALIMGRYSGYRLMELIRFKSMSKEIGDVKSL